MISILEFLSRISKIPRVKIACDYNRTVFKVKYILLWVIFDPVHDCPSYFSTSYVLLFTPGISIFGQKHSLGFQNVL